MSVNRDSASVSAAAVLLPSPTYSTRSPSTPPNRRCSVVRSVNACVGCSSSLIAFTTAIRRCAAYDSSSAWLPAVRATSTSSIPDSTAAVSSTVSPVFSCRSFGP